MADTAEARLAADKAALDNVRKQLDVLRARRQQAAADIQPTQANLTQAQSSRRYTRLRALADGVIVPRARRLSKPAGPARCRCVNRSVSVWNSDQDQPDRPAEPASETGPVAPAIR